MEHGIYEPVLNCAVAAECSARVVEEVRLSLHRGAEKQTHSLEWQYLLKPAHQGYRQTQYHAHEGIHGCGRGTPVVETTRCQKVGLLGRMQECDWE